ncbi:MAG: NFACT RNA binding domain-containing protein [Bacteroidota bacterium]
MLSNYFTLYHIAGDLNAACAGVVLTDIYSQSKNELIFSFNNHQSLIVSCEPALNALYTRTAVSRAKKNSLDFFLPLHGTSVRSVAVQDGDRELVIDTGESRLVIQMFGPKANVFLTDRKRRVIDAFLHPREMTGRILPQPTTAVQPSSLDEFTMRFMAIGHLPALAVLKGIYPLLGTLLAREVFVRAGVADQQTVAEVLRRDIGKLYESANRLIGDLLKNPSPRVYFDGDKPDIFSLLELQSRSDRRFELFDSLHSAVRVFLSLNRKSKGFLSEKSGLETNVRRELDRTGRTLAAMTAENAGVERAKHYELFGKLLLAHPQAAAKGMAAVEVENIFSPRREPVTIPLDAHLSGARNAERYFAKSKKIRRSFEENSQRAGEMQDRYEILKRLAEALDQVQTSMQWNEFNDQQTDLLTAAGFSPPAAKKKKEELPPFRLFTVEGGFQVWAGKNSENNDLLTLKHAKPNDLWFHARGSGGSHVVLRAGTGKGEISRRAIEQAAAVAAYYSKMKSSGIVPVAMTLRKYVRKPRGAPAGTVVIEREKVLMVAPALPGETKERPTP